MSVCMHCLNEAENTTSKYDPFSEYVPPVLDSESCIIV